MQKGQKGSESYSLALSGEREFFFNKNIWYSI